MSTFAGSRLVRAITVLGGGGLVAAGLLATAPSAQAAVALKCGATITRSVTLSQNINCTTNGNDDALTVAKAGVTINLNGHKILGPGDSKDTAGIVDSDDNVTIEDGTIANFWYDVTVTGSSTTEVTGLRIQNVTLTENTLGDQNWGVYGDYLDKATMTGLTIDSAYQGVELDNSQHCTIAASHLSGPMTGFMDHFGTGNTWSHSTMSGVTDIGIMVWASTRTVVTGDTVTGLLAYGVWDDKSDDSSITRNKLDDLNTAIEVFEENGAKISGNTGTGDGYGILASELSGSTYIGNVFSHDQYGIELLSPTTVTIKLNTTDSNSVAGIYVFTDGMTTGSSATLSHNTADKNEFGLYSQIPTTGGSNHAVGNSVVNCHNVACVKA
jgi:nitrous oxidase accessory protein NosD